jgi:hypothetical protein
MNSECTIGKVQTPRKTRSNQQGRGVHTGDTERNSGRKTKDPMEVKSISSIYSVSPDYTWFVVPGFDEKFDYSLIKATLRKLNLLYCLWGGTIFMGVVMIFRVSMAGN